MAETEVVNTGSPTAMDSKITVGMPSISPFSATLHGTTIKSDSLSLALTSFGFNSPSIEMFRASSLSIWAFKSSSKSPKP